MRRALLLVGNLLTLLSVGAPWLYLSSSLSAPDDLNWFSPWTMITHSVLTWSFSMPTIMGVCYLLLMAATLKVSLAWWHGRRGSGFPGTRSGLVIVAVVMLGFAGVMLTIVPIGLELGYPYYDVVGGPGGWTAIGGALCVMVSAWQASS